MNESDRVRRFVFERHPIRGHCGTPGARLAGAAPAPGLSTRGAGAAGRGGGRRRAARGHAEVRRHADAANAGQGPGQPAGGAMHARFQGAWHGAARSRSKGRRRRLSARWRAKARSSSPSRARTAAPATRASCPSPAIRWRNRWKPISCSPSSCRRACALTSTPGVVAGMLVQRIAGDGGKQAPADPAAFEAAWMKADHAMLALTPRGTAGGRHRAAPGAHVRRRRGARVQRPRRDLRVPLLPRARGQCAALAGRRRSAQRDRGAGRGHGHLRVLPEAVQVRSPSTRSNCSPTALPRAATRSTSRSDLRLPC